MHKPVIAFVTGGFSGEAEISYKSAITITRNIDTTRYNFYFIDIRKDGWWCRHEEGEWPVDRNDFSVMLPSGKIKFDAAFIGMHGTPGEDGKLQGYFDMIGMPYTACNATTSAITFNKRYTVAVAALSGIRTARSVHLFRHNQFDAAHVARQLRFPLFVKPANGGSSIGMSKVPEEALLQPALMKAFMEDDQVLVEELIEGREFTIGVYADGNEIVALPMTEVISDNYFFDFEAKYHGKSREITPAQLEEEKAEKIREAARKIYAIFDCRGVVRIDFIFNEAENEPYMLEVNTIPGQSEASIVPMQVKAAGMTLQDFYTILIERALAHHK